MEACLSNWITNIKVNCYFLTHNFDFFHNSEFTSHNSDFFLRSEKKRQFIFVQCKSQLSVQVLQFCENVRIVN